MVLLQGVLTLPMWDLSSAGSGSQYPVRAPTQSYKYLMIIQSLYVPTHGLNDTIALWFTIGLGKAKVDNPNRKCGV